MTQSHPPALLHVVARTLAACDLPLGAHVVVATSGGPDSMALLHALSHLRESLRFGCSAVSVDHGLRPEAREEVALVREFCRRLEIECDVAHLELDSGGNLQARAREARYEALWRTARERFGDEVFLATAHQLEDRAETVLLRLLRGTTASGLGVLAPRDGQLLRPLIDVPRARVLEHLERHDVPFARDPSNEDARYLRVRVRKEVLPLLEELAPGVTARLAELAHEVALEGEKPLGLNREQREQLRSALERGSGPVDVRLPRGLRLRRE